MDTFALGLLAAFLLKHLLADFWFQPNWMVSGKTNLREAGGYLHALSHAALSAVILLVAGFDPLPVAAIAGVEALVHFIIDYSKARLTDRPAAADPRHFWILVGADQMLHHLTYVVMVFAALNLV